MSTIFLEKRGFTSGLAISAILIVFFFLMKAIGIIHQYELRGLNAIILFVGIFLSISSLKKDQEEAFGYLRGLSLGILTSLTTAVSFSIFMLLFLLSSPEFMEMIKNKEPHGTSLNPYGIAMVIFIEAAASGFVLSLLSMQWFKINSHSEINTEYSS